MGFYRDTIIAAAPVAYWPLNETSGTVADNAMSGASTLNGTYTDIQASTPGTYYGNFKWPKLVMGENEKSVNLWRDSTGNSTPNGASVLLPNSASFEVQTFSIECWVRFFPWNNARRVLFSYDNADTAALPTRGFQLYSPDLGSSQFHFRFYDSGGTARGYTGSTQYSYADGHEYYLVAIRNAADNTVKIYLDGALYASTTTSAANIAFPTGGTARTWIGRQGTQAVTGSNVAAWANGVGHVAFYNRALTTDEITAHYNAGRKIDELKSYTTQTWVNGSSGGTPINAARLGVIETGISEAFAGRRQEADYVIVASDAPDYMKRGPKTLVCTGTNDQEMFNLAITDATLRSENFGFGLPDARMPISILLSPGTFIFSPSADNAGTGPDDIGIQRCVWTGGQKGFQEVVANASQLSIRGMGGATTIKLAPSQTQDIYMFDLRAPNITLSDFVLDGNNGNQTSGIHTGIVLNGHHSLVRNLTGGSFTGSFAIDQRYLNSFTGLNIGNCDSGIICKGTYGTVISGCTITSGWVGNGILFGPSADNSYGTQHCLVSGTFVEGYDGGSIKISGGSYNNTVEGVHLAYGYGPGIVLDNAHENKISGSVKEYYEATAPGVLIQNNSSHNDLDLHVVGIYGHGIVLDNADDNRIRGVVSGNGQDTTNTYDNVYVQNTSARNSIEILSRKSTFTYTSETRYGICILAGCNNNRVANCDLLNSGATASLSDAGTGTITSGNRL